MEIFSQILTTTDTKNRLSVTSRALQHLPPFTGGRRAQLLTVEDEMGNTWHFRYRIREGKFKKPELSTGWLDFVKNKDLKTGDKILFFKEEDEATGVMRYRIEVVKAVRVFGAVIGYPPNHQADR